MGSYSFGETISSSRITFTGGVDGEPEAKIVTMSINYLGINRQLKPQTDWFLDFL